MLSVHRYRQNKQFELFRILPFPKPEGKVDNRTDERDQGDKSPECLFFDPAEILPGDVDNGPAGEQKKKNAYSDEKGCYTQNQPFSLSDILNIVFT